MEAYLNRRKRNNDAVQKCREKKRRAQKHWDEVYKQLTLEHSGLLRQRDQLKLEVRKGQNASLYVLKVPMFLQEVTCE